MKTLVLLLIAFGVCLGSDDITKDAICKVWSGWGCGFSSKVCSDSILLSCTHLMEIIPKIIKLFENFDIGKIKEIINDIYIVGQEMIKQFKLCDYDKVFYNLIKNIKNFIDHFVEYMLKIYGEAQCALNNYQKSLYFDCGVCIGHIFKIIFNN